MDRFSLTAVAFLCALSSAAPARADDNTASTVAQCRTNREGCRNSLGMAVVLGGDQDFCAPKDMVMPTDAEVDAVLSWLEAHPEVHPDDWVEASDAALEALYPCSH